MHGVATHPREQYYDSFHMARTNHQSYEEPSSKTRLPSFRVDYPLPRSKLLKNPKYTKFQIMQMTLAGSSTSTQRLDYVNLKRVIYSKRKVELLMRNSLPFKMLLWSEAGKNSKCL